MSTESSQPQPERPAPAPVSQTPPPTPADQDRAFADRLRRAGLLGELTDGLLEVLLERVDPRGDEQARRLDLLTLYYEGGGDAEVASRRARSDRWLLHQDGEPSNAHAIVRRLAALAPELGPVSLERIGTDDGPLVVRAGDHLSAVIDHEDDFDTGEIDLTELDADAGEMISVRGLVRALNVLLDRHQIRERWIGLASDGEREAFVALGVAEAMLLCRSGELEHASPEEVMEFAAW